MIPLSYLYLALHARVLLYLSDVWAYEWWCWWSGGMDWSGLVLTIHLQIYISLIVSLLSVSSVYVVSYNKRCLLDPYSTDACWAPNFLGEPRRPHIGCFNITPMFVSFVPIVPFYDVIQITTSFWCAFCVSFCFVPARCLSLLAWNPPIPYNQLSNRSVPLLPPKCLAV